LNFNAVCHVREVVCTALLVIDELALNLHFTKRRAALYNGRYL